MQKSLTFLASLSLACLLGCDDPSLVLGGGPRKKFLGTNSGVSAQFGRDEARELYRRITSKPFRDNLAQYMCDNQPVPTFEVRLELWQEGPARERRISVGTFPELGARDDEMCVMAGWQHEVERVLGQLDKGAPIDYGYKDPMTGKPLPPERAFRRAPRPICDCSMRGTGELWVDFPTTTQGESDPASHPPPQGTSNTHR